MKYFTYCRKSTDREDRQVLSLLSQREEMRSFVARYPEIQLPFDPYQESRSAKVVGRPLFNEMLDRIEAGEADGVLAWHPDRLARNSMDGGRIIYMLDTGALKDLKFPTFHFENTPEGKQQLANAFTQSKYYVDQMGERIKTGNRTKIALGWRPGPAKLGYRTCKETRTTPPDEERFALIERVLKLFLGGGYSPPQLLRKLNDEWGFRTPQKLKQGGRPLSVAGMYRLLADPYYAGLIVWKGEVSPGKHRAMITIEEHEAILERLGRKKSPRPIKRRFAYTGLMTCGECGRSITAEVKTNRHGSRYTYYHCTRKTGIDECGQRVIRLEQLEEQIVAFLRRISLPERLEQYALSWVDRKVELDDSSEKESKDRREREIASLGRQLSNLTGMRMRDLLSDEEFVEQKRALSTELTKLRAGIARNRDDWIEPSRTLILFSAHAVSAFLSGDLTERRRIVETVGSNPTLKDGKLSIDATKPFRVWSDSNHILSLLSFCNDVRTLMQDASFRSRWTNATSKLNLGDPGSAAST